MYTPAIVLFTALCSFGIMFSAIFGLWVLWDRHYARSCKSDRHRRYPRVKSNSANDVSVHSVTHPIVNSAVSRFDDNAVQIPLPLIIKKKGSAA